MVIRGGAKAEDPGSLNGMVGMGMEGLEGRRGTQGPGSPTCILTLDPTQL